MMNLAEYRRRSQGLADFLPWAALVAKGVVLNKDGSFQRTARFRGPDLDSSTPAELVAITSRLNNALRRLGSGWAVFIEAQRVPAHSYPLSQFPDPVSALVDAERRAQFEEEGAHFESAYYLTLLWLPPADDAARAEAWLYENRARSGADWRATLESFVDRTDRVLALLEGFMPESEFLDDAETLTYLHSCISTRRQHVRVPETPMYLDAILADEDVTGGLEPRLGSAHLRTLTIMGFPSQTWPGLLDDLNRLAFPYRWSTRAICLDKTDAARLLGKIRRQWFAKRKSIMAILKEAMTNEASVLMDSDAANKALDADAALQELGTDLVGEAYVTATVTVWDEDAHIADERLRLVEKAIQGRDFTCMREGVNAIEAWLGSLPGHVYANVRQPPISTLNLAHMMPFSAVWAGPERDEHFQAPALFSARTEGSTPFRFSLHVGDVGHTLIVGPTGAGKSVLLALMALQFRRYAGAQVFAFDFGGSIRAAALAMGGDWHDLGGALAEAASEPVALQPLARVNDPGERAWAAEWVATLFGRESVTVTPDLKEHLWSALTSLASAPVQERTMTGLSVLLQSNALKQAIRSGCERATREHPLRSSVVHPLTRVNEHTSCGIEVPVIHIDFSDLPRTLRIEMIPKGSGSENNSFLKMAVPADGVDAIKAFVIDCVVAAGGKTCPPTIVGVGLGGTSDLCIALAKRAATRELGSRCSDARGAQIEEQLSGAVNRLGVGPQGLGGDATAFAVHVELAATHITMNPIAVNMQCHSARRATATFTPEGVSFGF
ncbi:MAG: fumarate hydratase [Alphaproteobacteria bacterium]|nr:fumarate hydratase [Alphaproteobacteria bacterium]